MYFISMVIQLSSRSAYRPSGDDGRWAHAAVLTAISDEDSELGKYLHDTRQQKRLTVAVIKGDDNGPSIRLTFLDREGLLYLRLLNNNLAKNGGMRLGDSQFTVKSIDLNHSPWTGISTWGDLMSEETGKKVYMHFAIPTAITKRDTQRNRFSSLFPDPKDIFTGLLKKWQTLSGPSLPDDLIEFVLNDGCLISDYNLKTLLFKNMDYTQIGFVGDVVYEIRTEDRTYIRALNGLGRFAFYAGIGYQTARGMGAVKVAIYN